VLEGSAPTLYLSGLREAVDALAPHASRMPPRFNNRAEREQAAKDGRQLSDALDTPLRSDKLPAELLQLAGHWNTLAWRLGYGPAAERAFDLLKRTVRAEPDKFEGGSQSALVHLERAHDGGVLEASFTLGMLYIQLRDANTARYYLEHFATKTGTKDPNFFKLLNGLRYGDSGWMLTRKLPPLPANARS
jgi:hypothetical protein